MIDTTFTSPGQVAILATAFVTLITTIAGLVFQFVREGRRHAWEIEAVRRHSESVAQAERERLRIAMKVEKAESVLNAKIDENTAISRLAFTEANHVNEKLAIQAQNFDRLLAVALTASDKREAASDERNIAADRRSDSAERSMNAVKSTVDNTADQVDDIHKTVVDEPRAVRNG